MSAEAIAADRTIRIELHEKEARMEMEAAGLKARSEERRRDDAAAP